MPELARLQHLLAVVDHGGFRRAAEAVHLSQPALTKSIKNLEDAFGTQLLDRRPRAVVPTPFGEIVIERARKILADLDQMKREVDLLKGFESGMLMVGCDPYVAKGVMAPALANLVTAHPKLRYEVEVQGWPILRERLLNRRIDLHVGAAPEIYGGEAQTIEFAMPPPVYFCRAGHPLARKKGFPVEDLLGYPRIGNEAPPAWTRMYAEVFGFDPHSDEALHFRFAKSNDWETLKAIIKRTDSISAGPREVVQDDLEAGVLVELDLDLPQIELRVAVAYLKDRAIPPAAEALIQEIRKMVPADKA
jgi:DNA-binding transcriptional LysR family regulator